MEGWKVGEVARRTGISVRTLHYYEEIGLLRPARRTRSGHRLYDDAAIERLYRIRALASLGLSLDDIRRQLARTDAPAPLELVERQLELVDERMERDRALRDRLCALREALVAGGAATSEQFLQTIEVMTMFEKYYTREQLDALATRREALGEDAIRQAQDDWAAVIAGMRKHMAAGTDPSDPRVQELARRWRALIDAFTGGDAGIARSLQRMYENEPSVRRRAGIDPALMEYVQKAWDAAT
jgi:DNA-binding transcriptional MerR regulator